MQKWEVIVINNHNKIAEYIGYVSILYKVFETIEMLL
jgi:hypothetical protein